MMGTKIRACLQTHIAYLENETHTTRVVLSAPKSANAGCGRLVAAFWLIFDRGSMIENREEEALYSVNLNKP